MYTRNIIIHKLNILKSIKGFRMQNEKIKENIQQSQKMGALYLETV